MVGVVYHIKLIPHYCDRCNQMKDGFYYTVGGEMADDRFKKYARLGEIDICEHCMRTDPKWEDNRITSWR